MKTIIICLMASAMVTMLGSVLIVGCAAEPSQDQRDIRTDQESKDVAETLTLSGDNRVAHAVQQSPSFTDVAIYDQDGVRLFSVDFELGGANDETIRWTLFKPAQGSQSVETVSGSLRQEMRELPPLRDAITAAVFLQSQVPVVSEGHAYDNYGCDIPTWAVDSCGSKGKCCDVHDACYAKHGCTSSSWYWTLPFGSCDKCNSAVVNCILHSNPGPSSCCAAGNCGKPR